MPARGMFRVGCRPVNPKLVPRANNYGNLSYKYDLHDIYDMYEMYDIYEQFSLY